MVRCGRWSYVVVSSSFQWDETNGDGQEAMPGLVAGRLTSERNEGEEMRQIRAGGVIGWWATR